MKILIFFVSWVKKLSLVQPLVLMTDCDNAQIAVLQSVHSESLVYLCLWHILKAMRLHLNISEFLVLWKKVIIWVNTDDLAKFLNLNECNLISNLIRYHHVLKSHWLDGK
jgi:hypothetical protein